MKEPTSRNFSEVEARQIVVELRELCKRHRLWFDIKEEWKPHLSMIRVEEISIKIDK